ncbi:MAG: RnfABCDGE type electron transport complex subunit D [Victivallaceae bacterium]|nr:RnfABCDGE type electron transport complex subunit D [Victivallaceae bacterium]
MEEEKEILMPSGDALLLSSSPHIQTRQGVSSIMGKVLLALLPAALAGAWFFGLPAVRVMLYCVIFSVGAEAIWCYFAGKNIKGTVLDGSAAVTGLLLALNLPSTVGWHVCLIGALLAIWLGKQIFGGLGNNVFNPALVARVGLLIALPGAMTTFTTPRAPADSICATSMRTCATATQTCATPLGLAKMAAKNNPQELSQYQTRQAYWNYFLGCRAGSLGETSVLAILIGAAMLIFWKLINWRVPLFYVGTVFVFTAIVGYFAPERTPTALFEVLTGGLMLGAVFMATDMVTSPITDLGSVIFAIGCGVMTCVIRLWGNYPEGVSFSILFMNALVPLIDRMCVRRPFGYQSERKA